MPPLTPLIYRTQWPALGERWSLLVVVVVFLVAYLFLDGVSYVYALKQFNITPWNPPVGLSLAMLLWFGPRYAVLMVIGRVLGDVFLRDLPAPITTSLLGASAVAAGYTVAAIILRSWVEIDLTLPRLRDVLWLVTISLSVALVVAIVYVVILIVTNLLPPDEIWKAISRRWVGDSIGIVSITPFLIIHGVSFDNIRNMRYIKFENICQFIGIIAALWIIFGVDWDDPSYASAEFQFFYLLFLPLIWIAVRHGLPGVTVGVLLTQVGLIIAVRTLGDYSGATVTALQVLMATLAVTSLLLGAVVSERKSTEFLLRDSEARQQTLLRTAPDGIVTVTPDGRVESLNPAAAQLFGASATVWLKQPIHHFLPRLSLDSQLVPTGGETDARRPDGTIFPVDLTISEAEIGARRLFILMIRDITQRKQIEARLNEKQAELAHVLRLSVMGEMASALAHEINQPLSAIVNYTRACQMLLENPGTNIARVRTTMDKTMHQADRAGEIIRRLREFLGKGDTQLTMVSISRIVDEVVGLVRSSAVQHDIELTTEIEATLPPLLVDNIQIEQVLFNLVRNSMDAIVHEESTARQIKVTARHTAPDTLTIGVYDSGPGLSPDIIDRLFTPFATTKPTGMGLGLSLSRSIIEAHGGRLWTDITTANTGTHDSTAATANVKGARFFFTLPIVTA